MNISQETLSRPVLVRFTKASPLAQLPVYATSEAAGADILSTGQFDLYPGARALIGTGLLCQIEPGWEIQVRPRSGLAFKNGVTVLNAPGTIDSDYRGELKVLMINHGSKLFTVQAGDRIAQIIVAPVVQSGFEWVDGDLSKTNRDSAGFGSTGASSIIERKS